MLTKTEKIWMDGKFVNWDDANVHILTHTLHYGLGVFEGIRYYKCKNGKSAIFRLKEHIERFLNSAHIGLLKSPFSFEEICQGCIEVVKVNRLEEGYIRPLLYVGTGAMGLYVENNPIHLSIITWPWGAYLGDKALKEGIRIKTSSYTRYSVNSAMTRAKFVGNYINSILAKKEAISCGYDEALLLDAEGYVCEGSGENLFIVKKGKLYTPTLTSVLRGITRESVITIASKLGIQVIEDRFPRDEIYICDEAFFTGTAAEITPIRELDNRVIGKGKIGPITEQIQKTFFSIVRGELKEYDEWLTYL